MVHIAQNKNYKIGYYRVTYKKHGQCSRLGSSEEKKCAIYSPDILMLSIESLLQQENFIAI